jgi:hypothetical protein
MKNLKILSLVLLLALLGAGCGQTTSDNDAIRGAISTHLAGNGNLNTSAFNMEIQKVDIQGDQAKADVAFHVKGGPGVMQLTYDLKKTSGAWAVVESNPVGSNFTHPALEGTDSAAPGSVQSLPSQDIMDAIHKKMAPASK